MLMPYFKLRLRDIATQVPEDSISPEENKALDSLPKKMYQEARQRLVLHHRFEKVRNQELVREAKEQYKSIHGKLFCEGCGFDFRLKYGIRGIDFIEAHHTIPIARITPGTTLRVTDLRMVCPNCHRMLHRPPWITTRELQKVLRKHGKRQFEGHRNA
jgi:predicted HNH restriction endonuclease